MHCFWYHLAVPGLSKTRSSPCDLKVEKTFNEQNFQGISKWLNWLTMRCAIEIPVIKELEAVATYPLVQYSGVV
jgi:hypothetical protein